MSDYSNPKSRSPLSPGFGRNPYQMNRSATSPMPRPKGPPSPDLASNMDSAFPFFPQKRTGTPTSARSKQSDRLGPRDDRYAQPSPLFAPLSPRNNGGESVMKRMNTIAPGPFDGRASSSRPSTSSGPRTPGQGAQQYGHRRTNTHSSIKSNTMSSNQRTSLASTASRGSVFSNGSSGLPSRPRPGMVGSTPMPPPPPPPPKEEKSEGIDAFLARLQKETMEPSKRGQGSRTGTSPPRQGSREAVEPQRRPPEDNGLSRRPTDLEPSTFAPRNNNMFPSRSSSRGGSKAAILREDLPPLPPVPNYARDYSADAIQTPSDSGLSEDSYASSGFRSAASSRSSPPTSEAAHSRQASRIARTDYSEEPMQRTASPESFMEPRAPPPRPEPRKPNSSYNRGRGPEPLLQPVQEPSPNGPRSPFDPAIQRGLSYENRREDPQPLRDPALNLGRTPSPRMPEPEPRRERNRNLSRDIDRDVDRDMDRDYDRALNRSMTDREPDRSMQRRPTAATASKGKCRGCSDPIVGRSVKDSSGRLTGRYHKSCFVCRTCRDPFPTAEFYVFNNFPYCEQHYHELNGSMCRSCNRGIEGQYLETDRLIKFHPRCFTCATCRIVLRDDYYELGGRNFCERHAYSEVNRNNDRLGPGGRGNQGKNLQKRRTRMMMMMS